MTAHRAEAIVTAVVSAVTGLTTTGSNVFRGRTYELADTDLPCLLIYMGADNPVEGSPWHFVDSDLSILIEAVAKDSTQQIESALNQIRQEVEQAINTDITLGVSYVFAAEHRQSVTDLDDSTDMIVGRLRMEWVVRYRRKRLT